MTVTDMKRILSHDNGFRGRGAARHDEIVVLQVHHLHCHRKEREVVLITRDSHREVLDDGRMYRALFNDRRYGSRAVNKREEIGAGEEFTEDFEDALASPHTDKPIMDERNARRIRNHEAQYTKNGKDLEEIGSRSNCIREGLFLY